MIDLIDLDQARAALKRHRNRTELDLDLTAIIAVALDGKQFGAGHARHHRGNIEQRRPGCFERQIYAKRIFELQADVSCVPLIGIYFC